MLFYRSSLLRFALVMLGAIGTAEAQSVAALKNLPAPLGLPRLDSKSAPQGTVALTAAKFSATDLKTPAAVGVISAKSGKSDYLVVPSGREWSQPLRGGPHDVTFVSFLVYGSETTVFEIGGAWLGVIRSDADKHLQLMIGEPNGRELKWKELGYSLETEVYGGAPLAALPVLTARLDPDAGVWDLFAQSRLVVAGVPLTATKGARSFLVRAGQQGAWVCGVVTADENPLFEDANSNGIEDSYERSRKGGALLADTATASDRKALADEWKEKTRQRAPKVWNIQRPLPDRLSNDPKK